MSNDYEKDLLRSAAQAAAQSLKLQDEVWEEVPLSPKEFFEKFLHEPCYPEQQKFVDAMLGKDPLVWDNTFTEGLALVGKGCVSGDTELLDADTGRIYTIQELHDLELSIRVHSWDGSKLVVKKASVPFLMGNAPMYEIQTDQGTIRVTGSHLFFTKDGWVNTQELKVGEHVLSPANQIVDCSDLDISDEKIKLIGYLIGDGNLCHGKDPNPTIRFYNGNKEILDDFSHIISVLSDGVINPIPVPKTYCNSSIITIARKQSQEVGSSKNIINAIVKRFGIYGKSANNKTIPYEFFRLSNRQISLLMGCLWATDGWIYTGKTQHEVGYCSASRVLCEQIVLLLKRLGIVTRIRPKVVKGKCYWTVYTKSIYYCKLFCQTIPVISKEKQIAKLLSTVNYKKEDKLIESFFWSKITDIKNLGLEDYFDLSIENTECYFSHGSLHHNGGKDRTISKILIYAIYKLICMRNPQKTLGINSNDLDSPESAIDIGNVSLNARLAKDVFFKNFVAMLKATKNPATGKNWFAEHGINFKQNVLVNRVEFPKGITAYSLDSEEYTGEGLNILIAIFDEVGGFDPAKAQSLYQALTSTQKTRFGENRKTLLLSYKRDDNDFMMVRYNQAETETKTFRVKAPTWVWNTRRKKDDFLDDYLKTPEDAKRIYECEGSTAKEGYFKYKSRIRESVNPNRINPIVEDKVWSDELLKLKFKDFFVPIKFQPYFIHVDLAKGKSSGDYMGLALGHPIRNKNVILSEDYVKELVKVEGFSMSHLTGLKQTAVVIDLVLQVRARLGQEIIFDEVRQFIQGLRKAGFNIKIVTYDSWNSVDSIQILTKSGIKTEIQSVDRNTEAYDTLKEQMYKGLLDIYHHPTFIRECEELMRKDNGKIDHPEISYRRSIEEGRMEGSKDVSDAVAGVTNLCVKNAKSSFSAGVVGDRTQSRIDILRRPDDAEKSKLNFYGKH